MTNIQTPSQQITEEVTSWPGVAAAPGGRGEFAFKLGRREIGHLHGDHAAHFSFPKHRSSAARRHIERSGSPFALQIGGLIAAGAGKL